MAATGHNILTTSDTISFRDQTTGVASIAYDYATDTLSISNDGTGSISFGDTASDIYIGDGTSNVDLIFEANGAIKGDAGVDLTLGSSDSNIFVASPMTVLENASFSGSLTVGGNPVMTGVNPFDEDTLQTVTDRGSSTTNTISALAITGTAGLNQFKGSTADSASHTIVARNSSNTSLFSIRNDGRLDIPVGPVNIGNNLYLDNNEIWAQNGNDLFVKAAGDVKIQPNDGAIIAATFKSDGNVGIGTTSPSNKLTVTTSTTSDGVFIETSQPVTYAKLFNTNSESFPVGNLNLSYGSNSTAVIVALSNRMTLKGGYTTGGQISFLSASSEIMRMTSTGLGIGTTNPTYKLDVAGSEARIGSSSETTTSLYLTATNTAGAPAIAVQTIMQGYEGRALGTFYTDTTYSGEEWFCGMNYSGNFDRWSVGYDQSGGQAEYLANAKFTVFHNGYVGIGETAPEVKLEVAGDIMAKDSFVSAGATASQGYTFHDFGTGWGYKGVQNPSRLSMFTNSAERVTIDSNGNVGIGTTNPQATLHVNGDLSADNITSISNGGSASIYINSTRPTLGFTDSNSFTDPNDIYIIRGSGGNKIQFQWYDDSASSTTETFSIDNSGNATFAGDVIATSYKANIAESSDADNITSNNIKYGYLTNAASNKPVSGNSQYASVGNITLTHYDAAANDDFYIRAKAYNGNSSWAKIFTDQNSSFLPLAGGTMTGAIDSHASDSGVILKSGNSSATGTPDQFFLKHNLGNVELGNSRGNINITSGNVGIGTTGPSSILEVVDSSTNPTARGIIIRNTASSNDPDFRIGVGYSGMYDDALTIFKDSAILQYLTDQGTFFTQHIGIATSKQIKAFNSGLAYLDIYNGSANTELSASTDLIFKTTGAERVRIKTSSGNVGIGTTSPQTKLHVNGSIGAYTSDYATGSTGSRLLMKTFASTGNTYSLIQAQDVGGTSNNVLALQPYGDNVGIGTTTPDFKLDVAGDIGMDGKLYHNGDHNTYIGFESDNIKLRTGGTDAITINSSQNVGIGTTDPNDQDLSINTPKLHVVGPSTTGAFNLVARFQGGNDNNNTGAAILINHSNDRGLLINAGRADSDREVAYFNLVSSGAVVTNVLTLRKVGSYHNAGIGVEDPDAKLEIKGSSSGTGAYSLRVRNSNDNELLTVRDDGVVIVPNQYFYVSSNGGAYVQNALRVRGSLLNDQGTLSITGDVNFDSNTMFVDSTNNRVGIGTTTPDYDLTITDDSLTSTPETKLHFDSNSITNGGGYNIDFRTSSNDTADRFVARIRGIREGDGATSQLSFWTENSGLFQRMTIKADGNVGIGTTNPTTKFHIDDSATLGTGLLVTGGGQGGPLARFTRDVGSTGTITISSSGGDPQINFASSANTFALGTNGSTFEIADNSYLGTNARLSITNTGNVGIGTTSPSAKLDVSGNIYPTTDNTYTLGEVQTKEWSSVATRMVTGNNNRMVLELSGDVVILRDHNTVGDGVQIKNQGSVVAQFGDSAGNGNVGIGTTSPATKLNVVSSSGAQLQVSGWSDRAGTSNNANGTIYIGNTTAYRGVIDYDAASTGALIISNTWNNANGDIVFKTATSGTAVEGLRIKGGGNVGIGANATYKLEVNGGILAGGKVTYHKSAGSLDTTGYAVAGLTSYPLGNGASAGFTFTCFGHTGKYQKIVYSCHNTTGTWNTQKVIDEGTNDFDVVASANGSTITFTFKSRSGTKSYTPRVSVEAFGSSINNTYA